MTYLITKVKTKKGIPIVVKDNICTKGIQTTAGSKILEGFVPTYDATVIKQVKKAGCVIVGKSTMDEFGFGTFSTNCAYGVPKNPHDLTRSCGGSSGGVAGYISASKTRILGLGQSTGGSISCPASFCGIVGLTPTYGLVSRYGLIDYASSLDRIGPMAKTVKEVAWLLSKIAKYDSKDSTSIKTKPQDYTKFCGKSINGLKIGVPVEYLNKATKPVRDKILEAIKKLEKKGAKVSKISLKYTDAAIPAYYIIALSEASTNLAKFCGMRQGLQEEFKGNFNEYFSRIRSQGFGREAKRRILLGTFARMAGFKEEYYIKALKVKTLVVKDFQEAFKKVDVIMAPTMPTIAPKFSEIEKLKPIDCYKADALTAPVSLAELPHLSVPAGFVNKMPVGLHLISNYFEEGKIIQVGDAFER
ncbi:Asp-tRNA(Asn)/Glu-tRNA(Gln) amidotransferase subunit GatA [Candidatus Woesearchaeota archaeon]|jgi:aspartyl-tRNA(Asn)/glutamyl-tRNA(Gln) amidotransferase subunit A|nr:Asp-tRNA(Asn)/Glu-tRNA(Gln) amidotransferase subunit GatA [Candidatus Woesearchaeota archaeon]MBT7062510.1 Asp-tRNA(Asn)/Glu-tRNA(Gln) amidotransferase subunit GatA [Candidatus Woesearchaeota archaeon]MBT7402310.1 Asp-tRNA(Asn)/Glu-tRNA(Gln) amidotransferase subunit GatA [Candidatus Woesearchaeota archaeon]